MNMGIFAEFRVFHYLVQKDLSIWGQLMQMVSGKNYFFKYLNVDELAVMTGEG